MKKKDILILIIFLVLCILSIMIYAYDKKVKSTDAYKFKKEYEILNNRTINNIKYRKLNIPLNNKMVYSDSKEIIKKMDNKETFIVYFGYSSCPWCRSMINNLIDLSIKNNINIYYVNIKNIRDNKIISNNRIKTTKNGDKYYLELLDRLDNILSNYTITYNNNTYNTNEKRIYAPSVVGIVNGKAEKLTNGISDNLKDPNNKLDDKINNESKNKLKCIFKCMEEAGICKKDSGC